MVDDEPEKVGLLKDLLTMYGYRNLKGVTDARQVIEELSSGVVDLIMLDLHMPGYDGYSVLADVKRTIPANEYLPIIILSGDGSREAKEKALMSGAMDFVAKPFNTVEILLRVRNLLHTRALHVQLKAEQQNLERRVEERTSQLARAKNEMLERLAMAAEFRDDETGEHIRRVGALSQQIALKMDLPEQEAELIGKAALLHDIGKIAIRDDVLLKQGKYTPQEFENMKRHTDVGGQLLAGSESSLLQKAERIARYHHERWDGGGYVGLKGEDIPLESRIVAVADVYDALISERPYKAAWPIDRAITEICSLAGSHFDPSVVDAFSRVMSAKPQLNAA